VLFDPKIRWSAWQKNMRSGKMLSSMGFTKGWVAERMRFKINPSEGGANLQECWFHQEGFGFREET
jgi:hypothetical protein